MRDMNNAEALQMMKRCQSIIKRLRERLLIADAKALAYDRLGVLVDQVGRPSRFFSNDGEAEDIVYELEKRIDDLIPPMPTPWIKPPGYAETANLGMATNSDLEAELKARIGMGHTDPNFRPVG